MNVLKKNGFQLKELIIIIVITSLFTSLTTGVIMYNNSRITNHITANDLSADENLKEFLKVYASLVGDYYQSIDSKEMLEQAMKAMFEYLGEDYSNYLNQDETNMLSEKLTGKYQGIGVQISDGNRIYKVFENSPAEEVGLLNGDEIVSIDGTFVEQKTANDVAKLIQASKKDIIEIQVLRNNETLNFQVPIRSLYVPAINYQIIQETNMVGYLAISTFSDTVSEQVKNALQRMEEQGMKSLILDLRGNTGGYLSAATEIASMFLEKGKEIYALAEKDETKHFMDETEEYRDYPIIILMNEGTASASEVLAAALKDSYGATLLGEISYGKGKVQQTRSLEDGSMVKYTTARWIRPNGDCIDGVGLIPDIEVDLVIPSDKTEIVDVQLKEALRILNEF